MNTAAAIERPTVDQVLVRLTPDIVDFKVGLFASRGRLGRAIQGVGSYALPGDTTPLRHPIRSGVYQAATPGGIGGGGGRIGGERRLRQCPPGTRYGGRFANRTFSNCGPLVFEVPGAEALTNATRAAVRAVRAAEEGLPEAPRGTVRDIVNTVSDSRAIQIIRSAEIPTVGTLNKAKLQASISAAVNRVVSDDKTPNLLIRRDGFTLKPTVSVEKFVDMKTNPDMENSVFITRLNEPSSMGEKEIPALLSTNMDGVTFAFPGGARLDVRKNRDITSSDARRLTAAFRRGHGGQDAMNYDNGIVAMVDASNGGISYTGRFPGVKRPYERITVRNADGSSRSVPRWVYEIFLAASAPQRGDRAAWTIVESPVELADGKKSLEFYFNPANNKQALIEFKTASFMAESDFATLAFQVKRVAAVWDTNLPGNGGYRCPPGTRYGGRITDRFGRNCGWNVSRRLANRLENIGRGLGERMDDRRDRNVDERLGRQARRQERRVGRAERAVGRAEDRLQRAQEGDRVPVLGRRGRNAERNRMGRAERRIQRRNERAGRLDQFGERILEGGTPEARAARRREREDRRRKRRGERADRLDQFADRILKPRNAEERQKRRDDRQERRRQRRGARAERLDRFADRIDGGYGKERAAQRAAERAQRRADRDDRRRKRRGERAERLDRFADRILKPRTSEERKKRRDERRKRRAENRKRRAERLNRFADRVDGGYGRRERDNARTETSGRRFPQGRTGDRFPNQGMIRPGDTIRPGAGTSPDLTPLPRDLFPPGRPTPEGRPVRPPRPRRPRPDGAAPRPRRPRPDGAAPRPRPDGAESRPRRPRTEDRKLPKLTEEERNLLVEMIDMLPKDDPRRQKAIDRLKADGFNPVQNRIDQEVLIWHRDETTERLKELVDELDPQNPNRASVIEELRRRGEDPIPGWKPKGEQLLDDAIPSEDRAPRSPRPRRPGGTRKPGAPGSGDPTEADMRNVRNRFRERGLPETPYWRDLEDNERNRELARRFDRYYDGNGNMTEVGQKINQKLAEENAVSMAEKPVKPTPVPGSDYTPSVPYEDKWDVKEHSKELERWRSKNATDEKALAKELDATNEKLKNADLSPEQRDMLEQHRDIVSNDLNVVRANGRELADKKAAMETDRIFNNRFEDSFDNQEELRNGIADIDRRMESATSIKERQTLTRHKEKFQQRIDALVAMEQEKRDKRRREEAAANYDTLFNQYKDDLDDLKRWRDGINLRDETRPDPDMPADYMDRINNRIAELEARKLEKEGRTKAEKAAGIDDPFEKASKTFAERTAKKRESHRKVLAKYFTKRYRDRTPWKDEKSNPKVDDLLQTSIKAGSGSGMDPETIAAKNAVAAWARNVFEHDEIDGKDGWKYRTKVTSITTGSNGVSYIDGDIKAYDETTGRWKKVGKFSRRVDPATKSISNSSMMMGNQADIRTSFAEASKNHGFASTFNSHTWTWARSSGFKEVGVSAAYDGTYVWGRVGFSDSYLPNRQQLAKRMEDEVDNFDDAILNGVQPTGIIKNSEDAEIIRMLVRQSKDVGHDPKTAPAHADYIMALSNEGTTGIQRARRERSIKDWFQSNAGFSSGVIQLQDDKYVFDDPRVGPEAVAEAALVKDFNGPTVDNVEMPTVKDLERMVKIDGPLGSNGGQWYRDDKTGRIFLSKPAQSKAHAENEVAMAATYRAMGGFFIIPRVSHTVDSSDQHYVISEKVDIRDSGSIPASDLQKEAVVDMGIDMLTSNWDVYGTGGGDNVGISPDGRVVRIDVGGAGLFRARGGERGSFSADGGVWDDPATMLTSATAPDIYGAVNNGEYMDAMQQVANMDIFAVQQSMRDAGVSEETIDKISDVFTHRINLANKEVDKFRAAKIAADDINVWYAEPVKVDTSARIVNPGVYTPPPPIEIPTGPAAIPVTPEQQAVMHKAVSVMSHPSFLGSIYDAVDKYPLSDVMNSVEIKALQDQMVQTLVAAGFDEPSATEATKKHIKYAADRIFKINTIKQDHGEEKVERIRERFQQNARNGKVAQRRNVQGFLKIVQSGRFKSQHETGTSEGMLDPATRADQEAKMFGMPVTRPKELAPIYGYVEYGGREGYESAYGDIKFIFKDSVRGRTYITGTDSLGAGIAPALIDSELPAEVMHLDSYMFDRSSIDTYDGVGRDGYMESQILGGLSLDDVESVTIPRRDISRSGMREAIVALELRGITIIYS